MPTLTSTPNDLGFVFKKDEKGNTIPTWVGLSEESPLLPKKNIIDHVKETFSPYGNQFGQQPVVQPESLDAPQLPSAQPQQQPVALNPTQEQQQPVEDENEAVREQLKIVDDLNQRLERIRGIDETLSQIDKQKQSQETSGNLQDRYRQRQQQQSQTRKPSEDELFLQKQIDVEKEKLKELQQPAPANIVLKETTPAIKEVQAEVLESKDAGRFKNAYEVEDEVSKRIRKEQVFGNNQFHHALGRSILNAGLDLTESVGKFFEEDLPQALDAILPGTPFQSARKENLEALEKQPAEIPHLVSRAGNTWVEELGTDVLQFGLGMAITGGLGPVSQSSSAGPKAIEAAKFLNSPFIREASKAAIQGAVVDIIGFAPEEGNIANALVEWTGATKGSPLHNLAYTEEDDDNRLWARVKNGLIGAGLGIAVDSIVQGARVAHSLTRLKAAQQRVAKASMAQDALSNASKNTEIPGELSTSLTTELEEAQAGLKNAETRWRNTNSYYNRVTDFTDSGKGTTKSNILKAPTDSKKITPASTPTEPPQGPIDVVSSKESINTKYDAEGSKIVNTTLEDTDLPDEAALAQYKEQQLQKLQQNRIAELNQLDAQDVNPAEIVETEQFNQNSTQIAEIDSEIESLVTSIDENVEYLDDITQELSGVEQEIYNIKQYNDNPEIVNELLEGAREERKDLLLRLKEQEGVVNDLQNLQGELFDKKNELSGYKSQFTETERKVDPTVNLKEAANENRNNQRVIAVGENNDADPTIYSNTKPDQAEEVNKLSNLKAAEGDVEDGTITSLADNVKEKELVEDWVQPEIKPENEFVNKLLSASIRTPETKVDITKSTGNFLSKEATLNLKPQTLSDGGAYNKIANIIRSGLTEQSSAFDVMIKDGIEIGYDSTTDKAFWNQLFTEANAQSGVAKAINDNFADIATKDISATRGVDSNIEFPQSNIGERVTGALTNIQNKINEIPFSIGDIEKLYPNENPTALKRKYNKIKESLADVSTNVSQWAQIVKYSEERGLDVPGGIENFNKLNELLNDPVENIKEIKKLSSTGIKEVYTSLNDQTKKSVQELREAANITDIEAPEDILDSLEETQSFTPSSLYFGGDVSVRLDSDNTAEGLSQLVLNKITAQSVVLHENLVNALDNIYQEVQRNLIENGKALYQKVESSTTLNSVQKDASLKSIEQKYKTSATTFKRVLDNRKKKVTQALKKAALNEYRTAGNIKFSDVEVTEWIDTVGKNNPGLVANLNENINTFNNSITGLKNNSTSILETPNQETLSALGQSVRDLQDAQENILKILQTKAPETKPKRLVHERVNETVDSNLDEWIETPEVTTAPKQTIEDKINKTLKENNINDANIPVKEIEKDKVDFDSQIDIASKKQNRLLKDGQEARSYENNGVPSENDAGGQVIRKLDTAPEEIKANINESAQTLTAQGAARVYDFGSDPGPIPINVNDIQVSGTIQPFDSPYDPAHTQPIRVFVSNDGTKQLVSGRKRLATAQRDQFRTINAEPITLRDDLNVRDNLSLALLKGEILDAQSGPELFEILNSDRVRSHGYHSRSRQDHVYNPKEGERPMQSGQYYPHRLIEELKLMTHPKMQEAVVKLWGLKFAPNEVKRNYIAENISFEQAVALHHLVRRFKSPLQGTTIRRGETFERGDFLPGAGEDYPSGPVMEYAIKNNLPIEQIDALDPIGVIDIQHARLLSYAKESPKIDDTLFEQFKNDSQIKLLIERHANKAQSKFSVTPREITSLVDDLKDALQKRAQNLNLTGEGFATPPTKIANPRISTDKPPAQRLEDELSRLNLLSDQLKVKVDALEREKGIDSIEYKREYKKFNNNIVRIAEVQNAQIELKNNPEATIDVDEVLRRVDAPASQPRRKAKTEPSPSLQYTPPVLTETPRPSVNPNNFIAGVSNNNQVIRWSNKFKEADFDRLSRKVAETPRSTATVTSATINETPDPNELLNLSGTNLKGKSITFASARATIFDNSNFTKGKLLASDFRNSSLKNANFKQADLRGVKFRDSSLNGADLTDADLRGADLRGADLRNTNLENANLANAIVDNNTIGLNINGTRNSEYTTFTNPDGPSNETLETLYRSAQLETVKPVVVYSTKNTSKVYGRDPLAVLTNAEKPDDLYKHSVKGRWITIQGSGINLTDDLKNLFDRLINEYQTQSNAKTAIGKKRTEIQGVLMINGVDGNRNHIFYGAKDLDGETIESSKIKTAITRFAPSDGSLGIDKENLFTGKTPTVDEPTQERHTPTDYSGITDITEAKQATKNAETALKTYETRYGIKTDSPAYQKNITNLKNAKEHLKSLVEKQTTEATSTPSIGFDNEQTKPNPTAVPNIIRDNKVLSWNVNENVRFKALAEKVGKAITDTEPLKSTGKELKDVIRNDGVVNAGENYLNLMGIKLKNRIITSSVYRNTIVENGDFTKAKMSLANFNGSWAKNADFSGADARRVDFRNAYLEGAKFTKTDLKFADFRGADLTGADFTDADLNHIAVDSNTIGLDLTGANNVDSIDYTPEVKVPTQEKLDKLTSSATHGIVKSGTAYYSNVENTNKLWLRNPPATITNQVDNASNPLSSTNIVGRWIVIDAEKQPFHPDIQTKVWDALLANPDNPRYTKGVLTKNLIVDGHNNEAFYFKEEAEGHQLQSKSVKTIFNKNAPAFGDAKDTTVQVATPPKSTKTQSTSKRVGSTEVDFSNINNQAEAERLYKAHSDELARFNSNPRTMKSQFRKTDAYNRRVKNVENAKQRLQQLIDNNIDEPIAVAKAEQPQPQPQQPKVELNDGESLFAQLEKQQNVEPTEVVEVEPEVLDIPDRETTLTTKEPEIQSQTPLQLQEISDISYGAVAKGRQAIEDADSIMSEEMPKTDFNPVVSSSQVKAKEESIFSIADEQQLSDPKALLKKAEDQLLRLENGEITELEAMREGIPGMDIEDAFDEDAPPVYQDFIDNINELKEIVGEDVREIVEESPNIVKDDGGSIFDQFEETQDGDAWSGGTEIDIC